MFFKGAGGQVVAYRAEASSECLFLPVYRFEDVLTEASTSIRTETNWVLDSGVVRILTASYRDRNCNAAHGVFIPLQCLHHRVALLLHLIAYHLW